MFLAQSQKNPLRQSKIPRFLWTSAILLIFNTIFLGTSLANSATMNRQEVEAIIRRQARAWENGKVETIVADFADDGLFIAAGKQFNGQEAIKTAAEDYFRQFTATKVKIKRIIVEDDSGSVEWDWSDRNRQTSVSGYGEDAIIFQLKNHKIVYWREYIEKRD